MGKSVMRIDVINFRKLAVMALAGLLVLITALIIGAAGPQSMEYTEASTYNCTVGSHDQPCIGGFSLTSGQPFVYQLPRLQIPNRFFAIDAFPFLRPGQNAAILNDIQLETDLEYLGGNGWNFIRKETVVHPSVCLEGTISCFGFTIVDEPQINHATYRVIINLVPGIDNSTNVIGDMAFRFYRQSAAYSSVSVAFRAIFGAIALVTLAFTLYRFRGMPSGTWTLEQRWILTLQVFLFLMNNPLYFTEIYTQSLFWPVLTALVESVFAAVFVFFALVYVDVLRHGQDHIDYKDKQVWLKGFGVFVYFVLSFSLYIWQEAVLARDPIVDKKDMGPEALFYVVSLVYGALIVWLGVLTVLLLPKANAGSAGWFAPPSRGTRHEEGEPSPSTYEVPEPEPDMEGEGTTPRTPAMRYTHAIMPLALVVVSTIIGVFSGSFGPFGRTAVGLWYFITLYNVTIMFWLYGWWPVSSSDSPFQNTERQPLVPSFPTRDITEASDIN